MPTFTFHLRDMRMAISINNMLPFNLILPTVARACKADLCVRGFPCKPPLNGEPGRPCPGYTNPEHPDDGGTSALESAKNRGLSHVIRLIKLVDNLFRGENY